MLLPLLPLIQQRAFQCSPRNPSTLEVWALLLLGAAKFFPEILVQEDVVTCMYIITRDHPGWPQMDFVSKFICMLPPSSMSDCKIFVFPFLLGLSECSVNSDARNAISCLEALTSLTSDAQSLADMTYYYFDELGRISERFAKHKVISELFCKLFAKMSPACLSPTMDLACGFDKSLGGGAY